MSSETPNEGGHKKPPIPTPAKKIPALNIEQARRPAVPGHYASQVVCDLQPAAFPVHDRNGARRLFARVEEVSARLQPAADPADAAGHAAGSVSSLDRTKYDQLNQQLQQARSRAAAERSRRSKKRRRRSTISTRSSTRVNQNYQFAKAIYDSEKYEYEEAVAHKASNAQHLGDRLKETEKEMNDYKADAGQDRISICAPPMRN